MAPEVRKGSAVSTSADIWSFGVLLWELQCLRTPNPEDVTGSNRVPTIPPDCSAPWAALIKACLKIRPASRITASQLIHELEQLL